MARNSPERFGRMQVIATDQFAGRRYRCPCGWLGWSTWGHAIRHADACPQSGKAKAAATTVGGA